MKNKFSVVIALSFVVFIGLGCGSINPFSSDSSGGGSGNGKLATDKTVDAVVGEARTGVPECDQVMDELTTEMNSPDDNFVTKAIKATVLNRIKDGIRESIEKNQQDKVEMAKTCKEFKTQLDKYKAEQDATK